MKIGVVQFPGSNCERETKLALQRCGFEPIDCFWHADAALVESLDGFVIVGGFSYEDRVRSGLIASKDPFMRLLSVEAAKGKPILGICNGAQILVESGLMGGPIALTANQRIKDGKLLGTGFYNDWVEIKSNQAGMDQPIRLPIAHGEGRFLLDEAFYQQLQASGTLLYTYCGENPNGSMHSLAAVSNLSGNIMAMMPHPERTPAGDAIFKQFFMKKYLRGIQMQSQGMNEKAQHFWVALKIHDNEAISLENTLQEMGYPVRLKKLVHWEITGINEEDRAQIAESDLLFNRQKETLTELKTHSNYLIRAKEDDIAFEKQAILSKLLNKNVNVKRDIVWCSAEPLPPEAQAILGNPLSHEGWVI